MVPNHYAIFNQYFLPGKSCVKLGDIKNGKLKYKNGTLFGDRVEYECNPGYNLTGGNAARWCGANGLWNGSEPYCQGMEFDVLRENVVG